MNTKLDAIVSYNELCWLLTGVLFRRLMYRCGVRVLK